MKFILLFLILGSLAFSLTFAEPASKFAADNPDLWPPQGQRISVLVKVVGEPESSDPALRAKEIRNLQAGPVKFVIRAGGNNVVSDTQFNQFTAQVPPAVIEVLQQRQDVISVELTEKITNLEGTADNLPKNVVCKDGLVLIKKYNGTPACVKPTSVYPLLQRGWASFEDLDTGSMSLDVAKSFIKSSPTFLFDGISDTLEAKITEVRESFPEQYVIEVKFTSSQAGYGDRSDQMVAQVITPHIAKIVVSSGNVVSAVLDEQWDELNQKPTGVHELPDVDDTVTQNSDAILGGDLSVTTSTVEYDGTSGFLAKPSVEGEYPGMVLIHEWWGLNENMKDTAAELASHGYIVLAVDLFGGEVATDAEKAMELVGSFDQESGTRNMDLATKYLMENQNVDKIGSIGWCFGGAQSLNLAINNENMDATVIYYGRLVSDTDQLSSIDWPVLGIFAELDQGIPTETVKEFESSLNELQIPNEIVIYPGVDHAFANPTGTRYAPVEADDAWKKTLNFLQTNLH